MLINNLIINANFEIFNPSYDDLNKLSNYQSIMKHLRNWLR